jgi:fimbrial chaperone protein
LSWRTVAVDGRSYVEVRNQGAVHARLTDVALKQGGQSKPLVDGLLGYVLPGAIMRWPAPGPIAGEPALQVRVNGAPQVQSIAPAR